MEWATKIIHELAEYQFSIALLISVLAGFITSFDPCMLGMASGVIAFQNNAKNKSHFSSVLTMMFSFSITLTFLGVISSFFGERILSLNEQYGYVFYNLLAMIFILLGCYMVGLRLIHIFPFHIVAFYSKPKTQKDRKNRHPLIRAYSLGTLIGLTPSPCRTPMILAMLAYSTVTGSIVLGGLLLFAYGIGHSLIFLLIEWVTRVMKQIEWISRWHYVFNKVLGMGLILIGLFFLLFE
ncbi:cytochrome c biogenesis protein CcdA [Geobacillus stearothermophilus]|jgi:cytochrome c-type biogenesis protein|uniref:cytochrome c biogenesis CcdA family protein n=2 Tax=Bacillales TaxID=1385 RepID=UPI00129174C3|nr:cytochrome c biogenesis protein CcdA [Geobacillus stearothermophilus]MED4271843.1 cytochrome c biogenesis protein CcdA [Geobacillus stearothermophilus]